MLMMLNRLRWQLTLLYLLAALGLAALVGGGSYYLLQHYFQTSTDLAIQYKMSSQFRAYGLELPVELAKAEQEWLSQGGAAPASVISAGPVNDTQGSTDDEGDQGDDLDQDDHEGGEEEEDESGDDHDEEAKERERESHYDGSLASIFVLPQDEKGELISDPNPVPPPITSNSAGRTAALAKGVNWRTERLPDGTRMRLLTYHTGSDQGPAIIQAGRLLSDQDRVLTQYLTGLLLLGGASVVLLGLGSWWLSGRSLGPTQRAWDQQQAFVSNASHELRTPLTLIKATAEVGLRAHPAPEQRQTLLEVLKEVDYMSRLVDDLLLLSRLDSHRLHLEHTPIDVHPLLADACQQADKLSAEKGVQIRLEPSQGAVLADPVRMRQVLLILLDNALRFTPTGGRISLGAQPHGKWQVIIVSDNGRGIPAKDLPHVFQRFYQASRPGEETAGNGLGLSIARGLVEAQGGKIAIESREGAGTRVLISLPAVR